MQCLLFVFSVRLKISSALTYKVRHKIVVKTKLMAWNMFAKLVTDRQRRKLFSILNKEIHCQICFLSNSLCNKFRTLIGLFRVYLNCCLGFKMKLVFYSLHIVIFYSVNITNKYFIIT